MVELHNITLAKQIPDDFTGKIIWNTYNSNELITSYHESGHLHRIDGPALIYRDGKKYYYLKGVIYVLFTIWFDSLTEQEKVQALMNPENFETTKVLT